MNSRRYGMWTLALGAALGAGCNQQSDVEEAREDIAEERQETREAESELRQEQADRDSAASGGIAPERTTSPTPAPVEPSAVTADQAAPPENETGSRPSAVEAVEAESAAAPAATGAGSPDPAPADRADP